MVVGNAPEAADFVVIGAGPGGYTAALHAAKLGRDVTLIDKGGESTIGGVCLHSGCIPSKSLIEAADIFYRSQHSTSMGINVADATFSMADFQQYKNGVIDKLANGVRQKLGKAGVTVIAGNAMFTDEKTLVVATDEGQARFLQFRDCVIATGSSPFALPGFDFSDTVLDAGAALNLTQTPEAVAIIGAGYIGLELGCALAKLGTTVTIIESQQRILPAMQPGPDITLKRCMEQLGVTFYTGCRASQYSGDTLTLIEQDTDNTKDLSIKTDYVLLAIGRTPNTRYLELAAAGITTTDTGHIEVHADRRVSPHIAAIGDITAGPALAHKASAEAVVAVDALCGEATAFEPQAIPSIIFTDPEIALAGFSIDEAKASGVNATSHKLPLRASGRATTMNHTEGYVELVSDADDGTLLGATIVAPHASELIAEICVAIEMGTSVEDLALTIHPHPTLSELVMDVAGTAG